MLPTHAHPILSCEDALAFERQILTGAKAEWLAMSRAGHALGRAVLRDFRELQEFPVVPRILVLMGKGHNAGDALLAAAEISRMYPAAEIHVLALAKLEVCRTHTREAYSELEKRAGKVLPIALTQLKRHTFDICLDGLLGMQFKPPLRENAAHILQAVNDHGSIRFRVAVDLPSGLGDAGAFQADFSYATGIAKEPLFNRENAVKVGRIRYLDIQFFDDPSSLPTGISERFVITESVLGGLYGLRDPQTDKRAYGHLLVLAGSRTLPGALIMNVRAAVRSGVGLVTAFVPESIAAACVGAVPEAMWVPWPETPSGGLALEGRHLLLEYVTRGTALLAGSGIGREAETLALIEELAGEVPLPLVLDADALFPEVLEAVSLRAASWGATVLTPHAGEYLRLAGGGSVDCGDDALRWFSHKNNVVMVLKGPVTRISDGKALGYCPVGGPVMARGGSGDMLAGLLGGRLAVNPAAPATAAAEAVFWLGLAADRLAREQGHTAVAAGDLSGHLASVLRDRT